MRKRIGQRGGSCPGGTGQCDSAPSAPRHIYTNCTGEKSEERSEAKQGGKEGASEDAKCYLRKELPGVPSTPIAQGEISMSVAFPTHVWKMPNICKHIIVWLFAHMCAFSHTYVSKSKHVWKIAPRCKYTNVFGFFQTCWVKVKHLPNKTCVLFYTQVWLLPSIFVKSQTCVKITMSIPNILTWF